MYHAKKTLAVISLISVSAIALGGVTTASAHSGRLEQHISYDALNSADAKIVLTERPSGRTERRESWSTSIDSAASRRLASNHDKSWTRGEAEGTKGSEDYGASPGQPESGSGSKDNAGLDNSMSDQEMEATRRQPESAPDHSDPRSHIHAGPHENQ